MFKLGGSLSSSKSSAKKSKGEAKFDESVVEQLFLSLCDPDDNEIISVEGIGKLCERVGIDPMDVAALVLVYKLNAGTTKPGVITKSEFVNGMKELKISTIEGLQKIKPTLDTGFMSQSEFRDFYKFVFQFSREGTMKTIEKEVVIQLLSIVLDINRAPHLELFLQFLNQLHHKKVITMDEWEQFLQFQNSIALNLSNMEEDGAWPLLLDEYVEWRRKGETAVAK